MFLLMIHHKKHVMRNMYNVMFFHVISHNTTLKTGASRGLLEVPLDQVREEFMQ